ncbi:MAG: hypothetical protein GXY83_36740 [Rhodopirellula sp.]|nr:hypothetical protein [Rhodopirellula sp.]
MGLFSRKSRTNAIGFSREFYDKYVFGSVRGVGLEEAYAEVVRKNICKSDSSFAAVSLEDLTEELRAVHLEMIGTAWTHASKSEVAFEVSKFTKQYLADLDRRDLWEAMGAYNQIVAQSATKGEGERLQAAIAKQRADLFDDLFDNLAKRESDREWVADAIARVANRIGSERSRKTGKMQAFVGIRVMSRLEIEGSDQIVEGLAAVVHGFYQGATEALDKVELIV